MPYVTFFRQSSSFLPYVNIQIVYQNIKAILSIEKYFNKFFPHLELFVDIYLSISSDL